LDEIGIGGDRIQMYYVGASDAPIWAERVSEFTDRIKALGPNPLRQVREEKRAANA